MAARVSPDKEAAMVRAITELRRQGYTWQRVGQVLRRSPQAIHQFAKRRGLTLIGPPRPAIPLREGAR